MSVTEHAVIEQDVRFTIYFIPLFSIRREVIYTCKQCGDSHVVLYEDYLNTHPNAQATPPPADPAAEGTKSKREKAQVILEGKVVGDEIKTWLPWQSKVNSDAILKWLYLGLAAVVVLAIILIVVLIPGLIH
jgi:hypothetical protein